MIRLEAGLEAIFCVRELCRTVDEAGVVDEHVQPVLASVHLVAELAHRLEGVQHESFDHGGLLRLGADQLGDRAGLLHVSAGKDDAGLAPRKLHRRLQANARCGASYDHRLAFHRRCRGAHSGSLEQVARGQWRHSGEKHPLRDKSTELTEGSALLVAPAVVHSVPFTLSAQAVSGVFLPLSPFPRSAPLTWSGFFPWVANDAWI